VSSLVSGVPVELKRTDGVRNTAKGVNWAPFLPLWLTKACGNLRAARQRPSVGRPGARPGAPRIRPNWGKPALGFFLDGEHLTAAIAPRLQVNMVRAAQLAGVLVLDIGRRLQRIVASSVAPLHARDFSFGNSHSFKTSRRPAICRARRRALIEANFSAGQGPMLPPFSGIQDAAGPLRDERHAPLNGIGH
jgi:hypothetical protein